MRTGLLLFAAALVMMAGCGGGSGSGGAAAPPTSPAASPEGPPAIDPGAGPTLGGPAPAPYLTVERVDADPECDALVPTELPAPVTVQVDAPEHSGWWCSGGTSNGAGDVGVVSRVLMYVTPWQTFDAAGRTRESFFVHGGPVPLATAWLGVRWNPATGDLAVLAFAGDGRPSVRFDVPRLPFYVTWADLLPAPSGGALLVLSASDPKTCAGEARRFDGAGAPTGAPAPVGCDVRAAGVSTRGEALVVEPASPGDPSSHARLRWLRADGGPAAPPSEDPFLPDGNHRALAQLLDGALASPDLARRYPHVGAVSEPSPAWLARRRGQSLRLARGNRAYAFIRADAEPADCAQVIDVVAPSGRRCATLTFDAGVAPTRSPVDGACVSGILDQGPDGTVVQQLGAGACRWRFWPGLLRAP